jgi:hypothetical protein
MDTQIALLSDHARGSAATNNGQGNALSHGVGDVGRKTTNDHLGIFELIGVGVLALVLTVYGVTHPPAQIARSKPEAASVGGLLVLPSLVPIFREGCASLAPSSLPILSYEAIGHASHCRDM